CTSKRLHSMSSSNQQQQPLNRLIRWSWKCTEIMVLLSNGKTVSAQPKQNNNFWTMSNSTAQNHAPHYWQVIRLAKINVSFLLRCQIWQHICTTASWMSPLLNRLTNDHFPS